MKGESQITGTNTSATEEQDAIHHQLTLQN
jgi:hypothetical protein